MNDHDSVDRSNLFNTSGGTAVATIRVLIIDDHPAVREGLAARIARRLDMEVCGEAADVDEAMEAIARTQPDVAIVDISLKTGNGLDLIKRVRAENKDVRILVWSMYDASLYAERAFCAGANGYITKEEATDRIIAAIREVAAGKIYAPDPELESRYQRATETGKNSGSLVDELSDRELQVFQFIGEGLGMVQIAERMHLSVKTIETYRARIKRKLNQSSRTELVRMAVEWVLQSR